QLKAQKGILYTDSNNIEASGDVIVKNKELQLKTQQLNYEHQRRIIHSDKPIFISGGAITLSADSMSLELNTQKAQLQGNVKSSVDENDFL
ncbi:MAG: LPS export ABC transporter periplasmic protein LptC, partial [Desulfobacterales bacterium]|nr:LPS export ABC transporter periplasmic protein LptC [Desulfobacterales bacterium]